jgi:hypothetical protein
VHIYSYEGDLTPSEYLQKLMDYFKKAVIKTQNNIGKLFEDPTLTSAVTDTVFLSELNKRLAADPLLKLPEGFLKVIERDVVNHYIIPKVFKIPEKQKICIEVLDSFLHQILGFHFLEPMSEVISVARAKPDLKVLAKDKVIGDISKSMVGSQSIAILR